MTPKKIGQDVLSKKRGAILSGKDAEEFERWQEEQLSKEEEREERPKSQVELKYKMPDEQPNDEQLEKSQAEIKSEFAEWEAKKQKNQGSINE